MIKAVDFVIIVLLMLVIGSVLRNRKEKLENSYSPQTMNAIKGVFAIMIVLFHLSQHINGGILFRAIGDTGYLSVAIFFFISGYGMFTRILKTGGGYCKSFISHRIPRVLLPWIIATMIYAIYWFADGGIRKIDHICSNHENGYLLITNSWFVIAIIVFYLIFFVAFSKCKGNFRQGIMGTLIGVCLYIFIAYLIGLGGWWFYSSLAFVLGMVWKDREEEINSFIEKKWVVFLLGWGAIFLVGYAFRYLNSITLNSTLVYDATLLVASAAFAGIIFTTLKRISVNDKLWGFLGDISFEIYLLHELVYNFLRNKNLGLYVNNDPLYVILVIFISIGLAYLFNAVITKRLVSKILR